MSNIDTLDPCVAATLLPTATTLTVSQVQGSTLHFRTAQPRSRARQQPAHFRAAAQNLPLHDCQRPLPQRHIQEPAATDQRVNDGHHQAVCVAEHVQGADAVLHQQSTQGRRVPVSLGVAASSSSVVVHITRFRDCAYFISDVAVIFIQPLQAQIFLQTSDGYCKSD